MGHTEVQLGMAVVAKLAPPPGAGQKLPLDRRGLRKVVYDLRALGEGSYLGRRDTALMTVGWAGMFRSSQLVGIGWESVSFTSKGGVLIYVPSSKTDQAGEGRGCSWLPARRSRVCARFRRGCRRCISRRVCR